MRCGLCRGLCHCPHIPSSWVCFEHTIMYTKAFENLYIIEMSNLVNIALGNPLTPISGGSLVLTCSSSQILDSEIKWLGKGLQSLHQGGLTPHHALQMSSGNGQGISSEHRARARAMGNNEQISFSWSAESHVQIDELGQTDSDFNACRYALFYCTSQVLHVLQIDVKNHFIAVVWDWTNRKCL